MRTGCGSEQRQDVLAVELDRASADQLLERLGVDGRIGPPNTVQLTAWNVPHDAQNTTA
jgi:hypothetical protein